MNEGHDGHRHGYVAIAFQNSCKAANYGGLIRAGHNFSVDLFVFINRRYKQQASNVTKAERHIPLIEFSSSEDFLSHRPVGAQLIAVELVNNAIDITEFKHPKQAVYVFGPEDGNISDEILQSANSIIKIPSHHCLNLACATAVVLYDRLLKKFNEEQCRKISQEVIRDVKNEIANETKTKK